MNCVWCDQEIKINTKEHLLPKSKGGSSNKANIANSCFYYFSGKPQSGDWGWIA